jgi:hypothetical protein
MLLKKTTSWHQNIRKALRPFGGEAMSNILILASVKKIKRSNLDLAKKDTQLTEKKLCSYFAKPLKQIGVVYVSSNF